MKTVLDVLQLSTDYLKKQGVPQARREAEEVVSRVLALPRLSLYMEFERPLVEEELQACRAHLVRRGKGEPHAYIQGVVDFLECSLKVTPVVLIPRQETEILADYISKELKQHNLQGKTLWDVCSGSGCLGIALKKRHPELSVFLSDLSHEAVALAKENAMRCQVEVTCFQGDLLAPFQGKKADYLVCNPPYISEEEYATLDPEVRFFEPKQALVGGESGLFFYERLKKELPPLMNPKGKVWFEIGYQQKEPLLHLFSSPPWKNLVIRNDWAGHPRFFSLEIE